MKTPKISEKIIKGGGTPDQEAIEFVYSLKAQKKSIEKHLRFHHIRESIKSGTTPDHLLEEYINLSYDPLSEALESLQDLWYICEDLLYALDRRKQLRDVMPESWEHRHYLASLVWKILGTILDETTPNSPFEDFDPEQIPDTSFRNLTKEQKQFIMNMLVGS